MLVYSRIASVKCSSTLETNKIFRVHIFKTQRRDKGSLESMKNLLVFKVLLDLSIAVQFRIALLGLKQNKTKHLYLLHLYSV